MSSLTNPSSLSYDCIVSFKEIMQTCTFTGSQRQLTVGNSQFKIPEYVDFLILVHDFGAQYALKFILII